MFDIHKFHPSTLRQGTYEDTVDAGDSDRQLSKGFIREITGNVLHLDMALWCCVGAGLALW